MKNLPASVPHSTASRLESLGSQIMARESFLDLKISDSDCRDLIELNSAPLPLSSGNEAINSTRGLFGMYRKADFHDPEIFSTALCSVFSAYPAQLCREVIDPLKGLPSKLKFPPSIAEVKEALDEAVTRRRNIAYRAKTLVERRQAQIDSAIRSAVIQHGFTDGDIDYHRREAVALLLASDSAMTEEAAFTWVDQKIADRISENATQREKWRREDAVRKAARAAPDREAEQARGTAGADDAARRARIQAWTDELNQIDADTKGAEGDAE